MLALPVSNTSRGFVDTACHPMDAEKTSDAYLAGVLGRDEQISAEPKEHDPAIMRCLYVTDDFTGLIGRDFLIRAALVSKPMRVGKLTGAFERRNELAKEHSRVTIASVRIFEQLPGRTSSTLRSFHVAAR